MTRLFTEEAYMAHQAKVRPTAPPAQPTLAPKRAKYGNRKVIHDRIQFDSKRELKTYLELRRQEAEGKISGLVVHPVFPLNVGDEVIGKYRADFRFIRNEVECVIDVKSKITAALPTFRRVCKHVLAQYGLTVEVIL